jgi:hypothetical protein
MIERGILMNTNYDDLIINKIDHVEDFDYLYEVVKDYNNIKEGIDIDSIKNKYSNEINIINSNRVIEENKSRYDEVSFLLHYLPRILIYRYLDYRIVCLDEEIKNQLFYEDSMIAYYVFNGIYFGTKQMSNKRKLKIVKDRIKYFESVGNKEAVEELKRRYSGLIVD